MCIAAPKPNVLEVVGFFDIATDDKHSCCYFSSSSHIRKNAISVEDILTETFYTYLYRSLFHLNLETAGDACCIVIKVNWTTRQ